MLNLIFFKKKTSDTRTKALDRKRSQGWTKTSYTCFQKREMARHSLSWNVFSFASPGTSGPSCRPPTPRSPPSACPAGWGPPSSPWTRGGCPRRGPPRRRRRRTAGPCPGKKINFVHSLESLVGESSNIKLWKPFSFIFLLENAEKYKKQ